jgi:hypothetical protein
MMRLTVSSARRSSGALSAWSAVTAAAGGSADRCTLSASSLRRASCCSTSSVKDSEATRISGGRRRTFVADLGLSEQLLASGFDLGRHAAALEPGGRLDRRRAQDEVREREDGGGDEDEAPVRGRGEFEAEELGDEDADDDGQLVEHACAGAQGVVLRGGMGAGLPTLPLIFGGAISERYIGTTQMPKPAARPTMNLAALMSTLAHQRTGRRTCRS